MNDYLRDHLHTLPLPVVLLLDEAATALHATQAPAPVIDRPGLWRIDRGEDGWTAIRLRDVWKSDIDPSPGISR